MFLENLSFELDEETLSWWCNDIVSNSEANGGAAGGKVKAVKFLRRPQQEAEKKEGGEKTSRKVHKHSHAGCAVVEFKQPARVSIEAMVAKHGATLLGRAVAVKLARAEFKKKGSKGKGKGKAKGKGKSKRRASAARARTHASARARAISGAITRAMTKIKPMEMHAGLAFQNHGYGNFDKIFVWGRC